MSLVYDDCGFFKRVIPKNDAVIPEMRPIMKFNISIGFPTVISPLRMDFCDQK